MPAITECSANNSEFYLRGIVEAFEAGCSSLSILVVVIIIGGVEAIMKGDTAERVPPLQLRIPAVFPRKIHYPSQQTLTAYP